MADELADRFASARSRVVEWEGKPAYSLFEIAPIPDRLTVEFLRAVAEPTQGLQLEMRGGTLEANGAVASNMVLWRDTAPNIVPITVRVSNARKASLGVWNVWRGQYDATQAWLRNAGMRVDIDDERQVTLRCSDGEGPATFTDLQVRLAFD